MIPKMHSGLHYTFQGSTREREKMGHALVGDPLLLESWQKIDKALGSEEGDVIESELSPIYERNTAVWLLKARAFCEDIPCRQANKRCSSWTLTLKTKALLPFETSVTICQSPRRQHSENTESSATLMLNTQISALDTYRIKTEISYLQWRALLLR